MRAADVTFERLLNPEPQNWLMNHHDFGVAAPFAARHHQQVERQGPEARCLPSRSAAPRPTRRSRHAAGRRRLHVHRPTVGAWSTRSTCAPARRHASCGRWTPARRSSTAIAASRCGTTSSSRSPAIDGRVIATDKETGKIVWDKNLRDQPGHGAHRGAARAQGRRSSSAPRAATAACATGSRRSIPRPANCKWKTYLDPGAGRARQRDLEGQEQRLADRRRRVLCHRLLRSRRPI